MEKERNLGVTEARFALTLLTCLLVAIGYVALLRLGTKDPSADASPDDASLPSIAGPETLPLKSEPVPRVLPLDKPDELANRPTSGQQSPNPDRR
jgi:hypothetical protein